MIDMADSKAEYPAPDCLGPAAIEAKTEAAGVTKANLPVAKAFLLAMFAGAFIAFGGLFFTVFLSDSTLGWGAQRVVGGTGRLDAEHFHGGFQRFLGGGAVGLGVEDHLGVVPFLRETLIQTEKPQIFPQNADIVKAPCEEHHVLAAPFPELFDRLGERHALIPQAGFLDTGELADPAVQVPVIPGLHHDLEFILNELLLRHPDGADLDDLPPDVHGQHLFGGRRPRPWLVPFHIQYNIIHRA